MFNRILSKIGEAAKSPQASQRSPSHDLDDGIGSSASAEGFLCPSCMFAFPSPESLQNHYEISHGQEVNGTSEARSQFLCPTCKMRFGVEQELQSHIARHHSEKGQQSLEDLSTLRKDLGELQSSLKEERLYSEDLKKELDRVQSTLSVSGDESHQATMDVYQSQIRTLEESKTLALSEIVLLKQHLEESRGDKELLREEKSKLEQKAASLAGDYATVQAQLDEMRSENELFKSKLSSSMIEIEKLTSEVHQRLGAEDAVLLRQELVSVQKMMDMLTLQTEAEKDNIIKQCKQLEKDKIELENKLQDVQQQGLSSVDKSQLEAVLLERDSARQELEKQQSQAADLHNRFATLQAELLQKNDNLQEETSKTIKLLETQQDLSQQVAQINLERERIFFQLSERDKEVEDLSRELTGCKDMCASLSNKKEELHQQLQKEVSQSSELQQNIEQKEIQVTKLQEECSRIGATVERLEAERTELCTQIEAGDGAKTAITQLQQENVLIQEKLQKATESAASSSKKSQDQSEALNRQLKELNAQHSSLITKEERTQAVLQETRSSLAEAKTRIDRYADELKEKNDKLLSSETNNSVLKTNLENKSQQFASVSSKLQSVSSELAHTQGELMQLKDILRDEQTKFQRLKDESSNQINSLSSGKETISASLKAKQAELDTLKQQLQQRDAFWNQSFSELNKKIKELEAQLQEEVDKHKNEASLFSEKEMALETNISNLQQELSGTKVALEVEQEQVASLKKELEDTVAERDSLLTTKQELESRVSSLETNVKEENQMKEKSQQQLNSCKAQLTESQEHATRVNKALNDLQELKEEMAERIQQLESECAQLSQTKENLTSLKVKLEHQLEERGKKELDLVAKARSFEQMNAKIEEELAAEKHFSQKAISEITASREAITTERDKLKIELDKIAEELKNVKFVHQSEISDAKTKLATTEKFLQDTQNELTKFQHNFSELESQLEEERSQHEAQVCVLQENQAILRQDLSQQQDRAEDLQGRLSDISGQKLEVDAKLENALDERRALLERCLRSEEECDKLRTATGELRCKLDDTLAALHELGRENQTLQIENAKLLQRKWTDDSEVTHCTACKKLFTVTLRKHHCRSCGNIFCNECSSKNATLASFKKPVRVCESCFDEVSS